MKRIALLFIMLSTISAWAYDFEVNRICYNINSDGTSVTVTCQVDPYKYYKGCKLSLHRSPIQGRHTPSLLSESMPSVIAPGSLR